jgi:hypothetical protein
MKKRYSLNKNQGIKIIVGLLLVFILLVFGMVFAVRKSPAIGAYGADFLRKVVGDQVVATMETVLFQIEDRIKNMEYRAGIHNPESPWVLSGAIQNSKNGTTGNPFQQAAENGLQANLPPNGRWSLPAIQNAGMANGAGVWLPYIQDENGQVVAIKTFVQPDPARPYAITAVVAFDLTHTRLHFVIGKEEPYNKKVQKRASGEIATVDRAPGMLLAAFNGGFKYEHGHFGASSNGFTSAFPIDGMGTIAIYQDGKVKIGEWGNDIVPSNDLVSFRQNGPLVIHDGVTSNRVNDQNLWGYTINGGVVTWRSGIALSKDGNTLFYIVGQYLTIETLAKTMNLLNVQNAMQLDINNFWVHFDAFRKTNGNLSPEPLFPNDMTSDTTRYLSAFSRDFFYVTLAKP